MRAGVLLCAALAAVAGGRWSQPDPLTAMKEAHLRSARLKVELEGDLMIGGLMMVHEREDPCGAIMPQGEWPRRNAAGGGVETAARAVCVCGMASRLPTCAGNNYRTVGGIAANR